MIEPSVFDNFSPEESVKFFRGLFFCEARYNQLPPDDITISDDLFTADQGIDASVDTKANIKSDSFIRHGLSAFQLKTGASFNPWQAGAVKKELTDKNSGGIKEKLAELLSRGGHYTLICFGHDFTLAQRDRSIGCIIGLLEAQDFHDLKQRIDVWGQTQILGYVSRYYSLQALLPGCIDSDFLTVEQWSSHDHMSNEWMVSEAQQHFIDSIRELLSGAAPHIRIIGEPGIGKTRMMLEAVRDEHIASNTLYMFHGADFEQTELFLKIIKGEFSYPLILILDELPEKHLSSIWGHLKNRCGDLKIISIDHGPEYSQDPAIEIVQAPVLEDTTIREMLATHTGDIEGLDRWVDICEGSPRVAQAIGQNLAVHPEDILKSPVSVPIWDRFIYGYDDSDSTDSTQTMLVMRYLSLFARFGFEEPVSEEARYICSLIHQADNAITWARFQEIIQHLRGRRILQGRHTLFIVPKALHIYLWQAFWKLYGRGFDFAETYQAMPKSLHGWFSSMFKYADGSGADSVVRNILAVDGMYADHKFFTSDKGASLLAILAEADPQATVMLIDRVLSGFTPREWTDFKNNRQHIVWALEKIAVWKKTFHQAAKLLALLALYENADNSNNATGTLQGLFRIGPEWAATEMSPEERLPVLQWLLDDDHIKYREIGLEVMDQALDTWGGFRIIGAENQGLRERARLWKPATYADWGHAYEQYLDYFVDTTRNWSDKDRRKANQKIIGAAKHFLDASSFVEKILNILEMIVNDSATWPWDFYHLVIDFQQFKPPQADSSLVFHLRRLEARRSRVTIRSRFERYVLCDSWDELEDMEFENS